MHETETSQKTILIIDSSLLIINRLISLLKEKIPVTVIYNATDTKQAVYQLQQFKMDIVILDIQLAGKNDFELMKFMKVNYPGIKVIILSNLVSKYYQRLYKSLGAFMFMDKSKDFDLVPEVIISIK
ncbi:MAG: response regulator [Chitinophagaceae bacterium]|nr:response regulator [Chitinophagaceae bacterium]